MGGAALPSVPEPRKDCSVRVLVLGGTVFLGRAVVETLLARGHEPTLFNRGRTGPTLFPGIDRLVGDRDGGLELLHGGTWDAVIDTSGYVPRVVRASAAVLEPRVGRYLFVSSISAYADLSRPGLVEDAPLAELGRQTEDRDEAYGPLKALCERAVQDVFGERATIVRPGLIVGPWDPTGRFTYWPVRIAAGGDVLAPEPRDAPMQVIDVRDLADWMVRLVEEDRAGVFNATGPKQPLTFELLLEACRTVSGSNARLVWVASERLVEEGIREWSELPLWLTDPTAQGVMQVDTSRARATGLRFRPLARTIADTLQWAASGEMPGAASWLDRDKERRLLSGAS